MADVYMARDEAELAEFVRGANAGSHTLEVCGFRSKREAGRPIRPSAVVSTAKLSGITLYEPQGLVISAKAGTPLHEVETALSRRNQELAFEPSDLSRIYGADALAASIGSVAAMNVSGPRRILRGAARDHLLGIRAVNGEGVAIKSGGRVMKNVTGVDLVRGLSGSWGTLAVFTELTFKVLPKAPESRTIVFLGLADEAAVGVMSAAMGTPYEVSGTIHLQGQLVDRLSDQEIAPSKTPVTALRLEGTPESLVYRTEKLRRQLAPFGDTYELDHQRSRIFWADVRSLAFLSEDFEPP
jgi:glycolate oxidase FAD binding subunit